MSDEPEKPTIPATHDELIAEAQKAQQAQIQSGLVGLGQLIGDLALEGKIDSAVVVMAGPNGFVQLRFGGNCDGLRAQGALNWGLNANMARLMAGGITSA